MVPIRSRFPLLRESIPQDVHAVNINSLCPFGMKVAIIGTQNMNILLGEISTAMIVIMGIGGSQAEMKNLV